MVAPLAQRACANSAAGEDVRMPFSDVAHLRSLSLLRVPTLTRSHPIVMVAAEGSNGFKMIANSAKADPPHVPRASGDVDANREESQKFQGSLELVVPEERRTQKQSKQDNPQRLLQRPLSMSSTWGPTRGSKWAQGSPLIKRQRNGNMSGGALACSLSASASSGWSAAKKSSAQPTQILLMPAVTVLPQMARALPRGSAEADCSLPVPCESMANSQPVELPSLAPRPPAVSPSGLAELSHEDDRDAGIVSFGGDARMSLDTFGYDGEAADMFDANRDQSARRAFRRTSTFGDQAGEITRRGTIDEWIARRKSSSSMTAYSNCYPGNASSPVFMKSGSKSAPSLVSYPTSLRGFPSREPTPTAIAEDARQVIRSELMRSAGGSHEAFRAMDLSGSRHVSFQEFSTGLSRLDIQWREVTGLRSTRELFKLFDLEKKGVLTLEELFPETKLARGHARISTPDFWSQWCRRTEDDGQVRGPRWQAGWEKELQTTLESTQVRQDVSDKRRWIAATMRRMKNQGKSDARCREVCAMHLPKGTGPKDREDVHTFSDIEVKSCRKDYSEQVNGPVRNIQKTVYEMREQRKVLQVSRQKLACVTHRRLGSLTPAEPRQSSLDDPILEGDEYQDNEAL